MELETIIAHIEDYGYFGLFLWLWLGVLGIPIPNEVITMSVGYASSLEILDPYYLFACTFLGLVAANTTSYLFGRIAGTRVLAALKKRKSTEKTLNRALRLNKKYRIFALVVSYFIPGLRTMVPLLFGISGLKFYKFALISYITILVWATSYFVLGSILGDQIYLLLDTRIHVIVSVLLTIFFIYVTVWMYIRSKGRGKLKSTGEVYRQ
ncbi:DedA family protein [Bacillus sp. PS06]|uniref:DedA family protein n=1 Tax=Bacillus sp. PS06 TaxID=2764176 RepID=UPI00177F9918|nr:DedA family protein [Bacillus sp. PS06]MBD8070480.1 DedA family protein [Bacillus sp. PS06]